VETPSSHVPDPTEAEQFQPSMLYVYEDQGWEYKCVARAIGAETPLSEQELNALGGEGWELVGVASLPNEVLFYLKRSRTR